MAGMGYSSSRLPASLPGLGGGGRSTWGPLCCWSLVSGQLFRSILLARTTGRWRGPQSGCVSGRGGCNCISSVVIWKGLRVFSFFKDMKVGPSTHKQNQLMRALDGLGAADGSTRHVGAGGHCVTEPWPSHEGPALECSRPNQRKTNNLNHTLTAKD